VSFDEKTRNLANVFRQLLRRLQGECITKAALGCIVTIRKLTSNEPGEMTVARPLTIVTFIIGLFVIAATYVILPTYTAFLVLVVYIGFVRVAERRSCLELRGGWKGVREFLIGAAISIALVGSYSALEVAVGAYRPAALGGWSALLSALTVAMAAFAEEPLNRGLVLRYAELKVGSGWAIVISAIVFAAGHIGQGDVVSPALMGVAMGAAYVLTRRLWMPIGLHVGVNLATSAFGSTTDQSTFVRGTFHTVGFMAPIVFALFAITAMTMVLVARRRRAFVSKREAWALQTGEAAMRGPD
jgi:uncharacterized protein